MEHRLVSLVVWMAAAILVAFLALSVAHVLAPVLHALHGISVGGA